MTRQLASAFLCFLLTLLAFGAVAGPAMANGVHYRAEPLASPPAGKLVVRDLVWTCGAAGCVAGRSASRPATDCAALVREVGAVRSFSVAGRPLASEALEKCNARAR